jgi:tungstate transport system substrate-binding protein
MRGEGDERGRRGRARTTLLVSRAGALLAVALVTAAACGGAAAPARSRDVLVGSTTTTQDTGLLDKLVPDFEHRTGDHVKLVIGGTGQVLQTAGRGDLDVLLVHSPAEEEAFVASGNGVERRLVMHNDFILLGPPADPAGARGSDVLAAYRSIARAGAPFISRGDRSGTNARELVLWKSAGVDPVGKPWYVESSAGQLPTLQLAAQRSAYVFADRGTWLANQKALVGLDLLVEGGRELLNVYHVIVVSPTRFPKVNAAAARAFAAYLVGADGQRLIGAFGTARFGRPLFTPDAGKDESTL